MATRSERFFKRQETLVNNNILLLPELLLYRCIDTGDEIIIAIKQ